MDNSLERSLSIVVGGYIFSFGAYLVWCFYFFYGKQFKADYFFVIGLVFFAITAVYLFSYFLISYIISFQKVWISFFLVLIITLLIFFLIPSTGNSIYTSNLKRDKNVKTIKMNKHLEVAKENAHTEQKRMKIIESKLNNSHEINDVANTSITELQPKLGFERKENDKLRKRLNDKIGNLRSKQTEKRNAEEEIIEIGKSNRDSSEIKINPKAANTGLDSLGQEIIFKIQIISSDTLFSKNSPKFMGLKNIWVYEDRGLYKYTVGNKKDLKSASLLQSELRRKGFVEAFVVAFKDGKRIPVREAWKAIAKVNSELDPSKIHVGDTISIPEDLLTTRKPMPQSLVRPTVPKKRTSLSSLEKTSMPLESPKLFEPINSEPPSIEIDSSELFGHVETEQSSIEPDAGKLFGPIE
jgi:hypothetical protein